MYTDLLFPAVTAVIGSSTTAAYFTAQLHTKDAPKVQPMQAAFLTGIISAMGGLAAAGIALVSQGLL